MNKTLHNFNNSIYNFVSAVFTISSPPKIRSKRVKEGGCSKLYCMLYLIPLNYKLLL